MFAFDVFELYSLLTLTINPTRPPTNLLEATEPVAYDDSIEPPNEYPTSPPATSESRLYTVTLL